MITGAPLGAGAEIQVGVVLAEVSARPTIAMRGEKPAYRDVVPGSEGYDVAQLQGTLASLGFEVKGDHFGFFGSKTKAALEKFYESIGYEPPVAGDPAALSGAQQRFSESREILGQLRQRATADSGAVTQGEVDAATAAVSEAKAQVEHLERTTGPMLPLSEVVFLPMFPGVVVESQGQIGGPVKAPMMVVASGDLVVVGDLNPADRPLVRPGMTVEITGGGYDCAGKVVNVGGSTAGKTGSMGGDDSASSPGSGTELDSGGEKSENTRGSGSKLIIKPECVVPSNLIGFDMRLTIESAASEGEVLAVPVAAISVRADGRTYVTKLSPGGERSSVEVATGLSGGGLIEINEPSGVLKAGDRVLTGG